MQGEISTDAFLGYVKKSIEFNVVVQQWHLIGKSRACVARQISNSVLLSNAFVWVCLTSPWKKEREDASTLLFEVHRKSDGAFIGRCKVYAWLIWKPGNLGDVDQFKIRIDDNSKWRVNGWISRKNQDEREFLHASNYIRQNIELVDPASEFQTLKTEGDARKLLVKGKKRIRRANSKKDRKVTKRQSEVDILSIGDRPLKRQNHHKGFIKVNKAGAITLIRNPRPEYEIVEVLDLENELDEIRTSDEI